MGTGFNASIANGLRFIACCLVAFCSSATWATVAAADDELLLHAAIKNGDLNEVKKLLSDDVAVDRVDLRGWTPLSLATKIRSIEIMEVLLAAGADPNQVPFDHNEFESGTPLHTAIENDDKNAAKLLLKHGAKIDAVHTEPGYGVYFQSTPLNVAIRRSNLELVRLLLDRGADVNLGLSVGDLRYDEPKRFHGTTALHLAAQWNQMETAKLLVERGANIDAQNHRGNTPLDEAVFDSHYEMVEFLVDQGTDVKAIGDRVLPHAAARSLRMTKLLIDHGASCDNCGEEAAKKAAGAGRLDVLKYLASKDVPLEDWRIMVGAAGCGSLPTVQWLFEQGCPINPPKNGVDSALTQAAGNYYMNLALLRFLLENGARIDQQNSEGHTALYEAALQEHAKSVRLLVDYGADPNIKTNSGSTASGAAAFWGNKKIVRILLEVEDLEKTKAPLLHDSIHQSHVELAKFLIEEKGFDVNARNDRSQTPLHVAAFTGINDPKPAGKMRELLIVHGADLYAKDGQGLTPLEVALAHGMKESAEQIRNHMKRDPTPK